MTRHMRSRMGFVLGSLLVAGLTACSAPAGEEVATAGGAATASAGATASRSNKEAGLEFAACMRENGVPEFPDPEVGESGELSLNLPGGLDKETVDAAQEKCEKFLPNGGEPKKISPADEQAVREFAQCMRDNGVPAFPDPEPGGGVEIEGSAELDPRSPAFQAAEEKCRAKLPDGGKGAKNHTSGEGAG